MTLAVEDAPAPIEQIPIVPQFVQANTMRTARETRAVGFGKITYTYNPRNVLQTLRYEEYGSLVLVDNKHPERSVLHIVRNNDLSVVHKFCVDMYLHEMNREKPDECPVNLSESLQHVQIEPVVIRRMGGHAGDGGTYGLIAGGRRTLSMALLYAMSRLAHAGYDPATGAVVGSTVNFPASIRKYANIFLAKLAVEKKARLPEIEAHISDKTAREAFDMAVRENKSRKAFTAIEDAEIYARYLEQENPETKEKFNLRTLAQYLGEDYQYLRSRHALNLLEDKEKRALSDNPKRLTYFIQLALARKSGSSEPKGRHADKPGKRSNGLTVKEMRELFDETPRNEVKRLQAICDCMGVKFHVAIEESDDRKAAQAKSGGKRGRPKKK